MRLINMLAVCLAFFCKAYSLENKAFPEIYYPSYCHQVSAISCIGNNLELEDGSVWSVNPADSSKIFLWSSRDPLVIYPVKNIFSYYHYRIENLAMKESIWVDLTLSPVIEAENSLQVISIDHTYGEIELSDNSIWKFSSGDYYTYKNWAIGDLIIIGMNESSFFSSEKFILINANMDNYCRVNPF